jgi:hypothetical protein
MRDGRTLFVLPANRCRRTWIARREMPVASVTVDTLVVGSAEAKAAGYATLPFIQHVGKSPPQRRFHALRAHGRGLPKAA